MKKVGIGCLWVTLILAAIVCYIASLFGVSPDISFELLGHTFTGAGWWALPLAIPGLLGLIFGAGRGFSAAMLLIGGTAIASAQGLLPGGIGAGYIIVRGLGIIIIISIICSVVRRIRRRRDTRAAQKGGKFAAIFSRHRVDLSGEIFTGAAVSAFCGDMTLDLSRSVVGSDIFINASCAFGHVTVILPPGLELKLSSSPMLADIRGQYRSVPGSGRVAYIAAEAAFGKVTIR